MTETRSDAGCLYVVATIIMATIMGGIMQTCKDNITSRKTETQNDTIKKNLNTYVLNTVKSR